MWWMCLTSNITLTKLLEHLFASILDNLNMMIVKFPDFEIHMIQKCLLFLSLH
jgi:hypothetical protein